jgi:transposase InsO family protein
MSSEKSETALPAYARKGRLYVAAVVDLFSRRVVGWSMHAAMTAQLVTDASLWVIFGSEPAQSRGPSYLDERTPSCRPGMSEKCPIPEVMRCANSEPRHHHFHEWAQNDD